MESMDKTHITIYIPQPKAGRIKFFIPYEMSKDRETFKKLDGTFYHYHQKLWSIVNTSVNIKKIQFLFGDRLLKQNTQAPTALPQMEVSKTIQAELDRNHQKMPFGFEKYDGIIR